MQKLDHRSFHVYWILKVGVIQRLYHMISNLEIIYISIFTLKMQTFELNQF